MMDTPLQPLGPYKLVSVNTAPERAQRMIARLCNEVKDRYIITHEGNAESMDCCSRSLTGLTDCA
jgi:hypothetical protein